MCARPFESRRGSCYSLGISGVPPQVSAGSGLAARALWGKHHSLHLASPRTRLERSTSHGIHTMCSIHTIHSVYTSAKAARVHWHNSIKGQGRELLSSAYNSTSRSFHFNGKFLLRNTILHTKEDINPSRERNLCFWHPYAGDPGYVIRVTFSDANQTQIYIQIL